MTSLGLQRQRARAFKTVAMWILETHRGEIPKDSTRLTAIPGLGPYSGSAIACFGFRARVPIIDGNVVRILRRVFQNSMQAKPTAIELRKTARNLLPDVDYTKYNYGLLDLGRLVCRPSNPRCPKCPLIAICDHYANQIKGSRANGVIREGQTKINRLRSARIKRGLSLVKLARCAGVSKTTVINIEAGRTTPRRSTFAQIGTRA